MTASAAQKDDENYLKKVREQYENYPYPSVDPEQERVTPRIPVTESFERLNHFCFGGRRDFRKEFRTLVAGGGTGDAAVALAEQLRGTGNEVVYVDMSEASMKIAQRRASIRGLTNIRWIRDSLLNIPNMDLGKFDYVNCSGVLHHLADPDAGLQILSDALKDDGAMGIMLYAKYGRMPVYIMQDILRMINRGEENLQRQVDNAKAVLGNLPLTNWLFSASQMIREEISVGGDVGIYDLLLHSQDRAYSIPELYEFLGKSKLTLTELFSDYQNINHQIYSPSFYVRDESMVRKVEALSLKEQRSLAELLHGKIEKHTFYAMKNPIPEPTIDDLDMVPVLGFGIATDHAAVTKLIAQQGNVLEIYQPASDVRAICAKGPYLADIWAKIDGKRSLGEIYRSIKGADVETLATQFKPFYDAMRRAQWLLLRHKSTAPIIYPAEMQKRIPTHH